MNTHPDDELLQSLIDGELDDVAATATRVRLQQEPAFARRHQELAAVRAAIDDALANSPVVARPAPRHARSFPNTWLAAAVALFAIGIVVAIGWQQPDPKAAGWQDNELFGVRIVPHRGGSWSMFSPATFGLDLRAHGPHGLVLRAWPAGRSLADVAATFAATSPTGAALPFAVEATVRDPTGQRWSAQLDFGAEVTPGRPLDVALDELRLQRPGLPPYFAVRPDGAGWKPDALWFVQRFGAGEPTATQRLLLDERGEWQIELRLVSLLPPAGARWLTFAHPLVVSTIVRCDGATTAWSQPVDFMQARMLLQNATLRAADGNPLLALQLRHDSPRARHYNVIGITRADVPQPLHCQLLVDGKPCSQPPDLPVTIPAEMGFQPHEPGTTRTVVASLQHYWLDGKPLASLRGRHRLSFRFAFSPTVWDGPADHYWMGEVTTPEVEVDFRD
ncbi:MAG: hypothetical protein IPK26_00130 [Planctomycetes bacterium]|nr:hypothetical protein [Planctomycetota bacterium]